MLTGQRLPLLLIVTTSAFFYRAAELEGYPKVIWGGLSVLVSLSIWLGLGGGFFSILVGQLGLFAAITVYRLHREP